MWPVPLVLLLILPDAAAQSPNDVDPHHIAMYRPAIQEKSARQRERGRKNVGYKGREIERKRDQRSNAHSTNYKCNESLLAEAIGEQQGTACTPK